MRLIALIQPLTMIMMNLPCAKTQIVDYFEPQILLNYDNRTKNEESSSFGAYESKRKTKFSKG